MFSLLIARLRAFLQARAIDQDIHDEIQTHLAREVERLTATGVAPDAAARQARREFGNVALEWERARDVYRWHWVSTVGQDVRHGVRVLRRGPVYTCTAFLSLALGIGASTALFGLVDALLLKPLPVVAPHEIVQLARVGGGNSSYSEYRALRSASRQLADVFGATVSSRPYDIRVNGSTEAAYLQVVTDNYFEALGVPSLIGRLFRPRGAGKAGEAATAVISERYWREHYGGDPAVLGQRFQLGRRNVDFTIGGVAARGFDGVHIDTPADIWIAMEEAFPDEADRLVRMMGRLAPGATLASAGAEVRTLIERPMNVIAGATGYSNLRARLGGPLVLLALLVGLVLLVACANLANLALSGMVARERELALRRAIGASGARVARQVLVEHLMLSTAGVLAGVLLAQWLSSALLAFLPAEQNRALVTLSFELDGRVLGFASGLCLLTTVLCGLAPAWYATRQGAAPLLRGGGGAGAQSRQWTSRGLVVAQVAICMLLLVVAGAFIRTIHNLRTQDTGYVERDVMVADVMPPFEYGEARRDSLLEELRTRAAALPGVMVAAFGHTGQLSGFEFRYPVHSPDVPPGVGDIQAMEQRISPGFLAAMGTRIVSGRDISTTDRPNAPAVALVNGAFVRQLTLRGNPVGQRFVKTGGSRRFETIEIIGVVEDAKWFTLREDPQPIFYRSYQQLSGMPQVRFAIRVSGGIDQVAMAFRQLAVSIDPGITLTNVVPFREIIDRTLVTERLVSQVSMALALFALLVASIGLFGVLASGVARRRREIGVRIAVGASPGAVEWMLIKESLVLLAIGLGIGLPAAIVVTQVTSAMLFRVAPGDPVSIVAAVGALLTTTFLAAYVPAHRAAGISPIVVLREE